MSNLQKIVLNTLKKTRGACLVKICNLIILDKNSKYNKMSKTLKLASKRDIFYLDHDNLKARKDMKKFRKRIKRVITKCIEDGTISQNKNTYKIPKNTKINI